MFSWRITMDSRLFPSVIRSSSLESELDDELSIASAWYAKGGGCGLNLATSGCWKGDALCPTGILSEFPRFSFFSGSCKLKSGKLDEDTKWRFVARQRMLIGLSFCRPVDNVTGVAWTSEECEPTGILCDCYENMTVARLCFPSMPTTAVVMKPLRMSSIVSKTSTPTPNFSVSVMTSMRLRRFPSPFLVINSWSRSVWVRSVVWKLTR